MWRRLGAAAARDNLPIDSNTDTRELLFLLGLLFWDTGLFQAIQETWASHCYGLVAFSDVADLELNTYESIELL